jgi:ribosomal protein S18 acetylase RimI-like enzyme
MARNNLSQGIRVVGVDAPAERSHVCESILRSLPQWFGIESANLHYVEAVKELETLAAEQDGGAVGFLSIKRHSPRAAEIYVMGVLPDHHRQGVGSALIREAESLLRAQQVEYLQVKTLGPSDPDESYAGTRRFYERCGFVPLEELHDLWDANPCLIMVKHL